MKEVINLKMVAMEEGTTLDPKQVMDSLQMLQFGHSISLDSERMLVLVDVSDRTASQKVWEAAGRRFPLAFCFDPESVGGKAVLQLLESLSDTDREDVDFFRSKIGCRCSLYIKRERADLARRFWAAMFPPSEKPESARRRGGRNRLAERITVKLPEDLVLEALQNGSILDKAIYPDGSVYVTENSYRQLRQEQERNLVGLAKKPETKTYFQRGGR